MTRVVASSTGVADLIDQICNFAISNAGFTDSGNVTLSGSRTMRRIAKGGVIYHFFPYVTGAVGGIRGYMSYTALTTDSTDSTHSQAELSTFSCWTFGGPYANVYKYAHNDAVYICCELSPTIYNHMAFGIIDKTETFTGGEFLTMGSADSKISLTQYYGFGGYNNPAFPGRNAGAYSTSFIRNVLPSGAFNDSRDFAKVGALTGPSQWACFSAFNGIYEKLMRDSPNTATLRTIVLPLYAFIYDPITQLFRTSGTFSGVRLVANTLLDPAETILNGDFECFPMSQKNASGINCPTCGKFGLAYATN